MKKSDNHLNDFDDAGGITFEVVESEAIDGQRQVRKGVYLVPNLITTASMLCAFSPSSLVVKVLTIRRL